jgi:hypothetical protein
MENFKLKKGERLSLALSVLNIGDKLEVPYKLCGEQAIRTATWRVKRDTGANFEVNSKGSDKAIVTRI